MSKGGRQTQTGNLYGTVTDQQGEPLPGVTVTATSPQVGERVQVTDADGRFRFLSLAPGSYAVEAMLEGFSTVRYPDVQIRLGRDTTLDIEMSPAVEEA